MIRQLDGDLTDEEIPIPARIGSKDAEMVKKIDSIVKDSKVA